MKRSSLLNIIYFSLFLNIVVLIAFCMINVAKADEVKCSKHPIYCQIKKNSPKINSAHAMRLSSVIFKATKKYSISPVIFTAILAQESSYNLGAKSKHRGYRHLTPKERDLSIDICWLNADMDFGINGNTDNEIAEALQGCLDKADNKMINTVVYSDFGIGQIHVRTIKNFGFEVELLTTNLEYSIEAAAIVLSDFQKRYEKREFYWWTRYNASSKHKRKIYRNLVERYF